MAQQAGFHAPNGGTNFLGMRRTRAGTTEIIYDDGAARRMVWRVEGAANEANLAEALRVAIGAVRVVPSLHDELKKRLIAVEHVTG